MFSQRLAVWFLLGSIILPAQTFEVASIKPNAASDHRVSIQMQPGGRFVATGVPIRLLIGLAYNVRDFQITGGPSWMNDQFYDVNAKAETGKDRVTMEEMRPMFKAAAGGPVWSQGARGNEGDAGLRAA